MSHFSSAWVLLCSHSVVALQVLIQLSWTQLKNCLVIFDTSGSRSWPSEISTNWWKDDPVRVTARRSYNLQSFVVITMLLQGEGALCLPVAREWTVHSPACNVMKPFLSTSNSAKRAATWPAEFAALATKLDELLGKKIQFSSCCL